MPGCTAYYGQPSMARRIQFVHTWLNVGLYSVLKPEATQTLFVSAASGAVGQTVCLMKADPQQLLLQIGQLAKVSGCRVVGTAGGAEKVKLCTSTFGYDAAIDYKVRSPYLSCRYICLSACHAASAFHIICFRFISFCLTHSKTGQNQRAADCRAENALSERH